MSLPDLPRTSRAAVLTEFNAPLTVQDVPVPETIEPGALLVKIEAASLCGSDVHLRDGSLGATMGGALPIIPGHEMVGQIVRMGDDAEVDSVGQALGPGDRIVFTHAACGRCHYCVAVNQPGLCKQRKYYMFSGCANYPFLTGGLSEYCYVFPTSGRIRVPDDVKDEWASAASCALRTVVHAFQRLGQIEPWQTVVVQGSGPLGLFATAIADHVGAGRLIVVGGPANRLKLAEQWGATDTVSVEEFGDEAVRVDRVRELTGARAPTSSSSSQGRAPPLARASR